MFQRELNSIRKRKNKFKNLLIYGGVGNSGLFLQEADEQETRNGGGGGGPPPPLSFLPLKDLGSKSSSLMTSPTTIHMHTLNMDSLLEVCMSKMMEEEKDGFILLVDLDWQQLECSQILPHLCQKLEMVRRALEGKKSSNDDDHQQPQAWNKKSNDQKVRIPIIVALSNSDLAIDPSITTEEQYDFFLQAVRSICLSCISLSLSLISRWRRTVQYFKEKT
jgi:hypothetical protein